ncbi:MAG: carbamoyl phosphate synthase small subunit [Crocinitomicaceae bacterium]|nr:carbamoyl phosphate synthase small subunit [Crocinitomicaceae bacterium]|tara:strand:- start:2773 stop:3882 length:1110 start_codon:yes stop_codon:yes gene_type:complete
MKFKHRPDAVLLLQDGTVFRGKAVGQIGTATGEIAFNTGMYGYQEIFTDPSYYGQMLLLTTSHVGNYGIAADEIESESIKIEGLVCKKFSENYSRPAAVESLQDYFVKNNRVGISDVDTRALTRHIRSQGAMNAIVSSETSDIEELKAKLKEVPSMEGLELSSKVSTKEAFFFGDESASHRVAVLDLGVKKNILRCLAERDCYLNVFPHDASFEEMEKWNPDAYMLSNGPGDPSVMEEQIKTVGKIIDSGKPTFGICLGHQVLALSQGLTTSKMHNGHRGVNHPVKNLATSRCEVTSQNHGFVVDWASAEANENIEITHQHLNDDTLAGIKVLNKNAFSVQYHPESSAGPNDSRYLFDQFINNIKKHKS